MSLVEQKYNEALDRMSGMERLRRTLSLFGSICEMLTLQVVKDNPGLNEREIRLKVAARLYASDPGALRLLTNLRAA